MWGHFDLYNLQQYLKQQNQQPFLFGWLIQKVHPWGMNFLLTDVRLQINLKLFAKLVNLQI